MRLTWAELGVLFWGLFKIVVTIWKQFKGLGQQAQDYAVLDKRRLAGLRASRQNHHLRENAPAEEKDPGTYPNWMRKPCEPHHTVFLDGWHD